MMGEKLINCPECSTEITEQMRFCPHCGKPLQANSTTPEKEWFYMSAKANESIGWHLLDQISESLQHGPVSEEALNKLFKSEQITPDTLVWKQGLSGWTKARDIGGLVPVSDKSQVTTETKEILESHQDEEGKRWFYISEERQHGPVSDSTLIELFKSNQLTPETLVWSQCFHSWVKACNIGGLVPPSYSAPAMPDMIRNNTDEKIKAIREPYPWRTVLLWIIIFYIVGFIFSPIRVPRELYDNQNPNSILAFKLVFKFFLAFVWAFLGGLSIGIYKYFRRSKQKGLEPPSNDPPLPETTQPFETQSEYAPSGEQVRPWVRYWARTIDISIFSATAGFVLGSVLGLFNAVWIVRTHPYMFAWLCLFVDVFIEAVTLAALGTTPGKALLRVRLRNSDGSRPSYSRALGRAFNVLIMGLGFGIPFVSVFTVINAYYRLTNKGITSWDREGNFIVSHQNIGGFRVFLAIIFILLVFIISVIANNIIQNA